jgi:hypothetical protein
MSYGQALKDAVYVLLIFMPLGAREFIESKHQLFRKLIVLIKGIS